MTLGVLSWGLGSGIPGRVTHVALANRVFIESGTTSLLFALIVWQLARGDGLVKRLLSRPSLLLLGEASYAVYVLQDPMLAWTTAILKRLSPTLMTHWNVVFWAYALLLVVVSIVIHKKWEMPVRAVILRRWTARTERVAAP